MSDEKSGKKNLQVREAGWKKVEELASTVDTSMCTAGTLLLETASIDEAMDLHHARARETRERRRAESTPVQGDETPAPKPAHAPRQPSRPTD